MNEPAPQNNFAREETIFNAAVQLRDPARQAIYLDLACEGDAVLRARIEKLLTADADESLSLGRVRLPEPADLPSAAGEERPEAEVLDTRIGPYKLLQKIGEGGCGVVY